MRIMMIAATVAPYPRGKGEVCKTFMHRFDSGRRLTNKAYEIRLGKPAVSSGS